MAPRRPSATETQRHFLPLDDVISWFTGQKTKFDLQVTPCDLRAIEDWDVGGLMINDVPIYRIDNMPFGGWKLSGFGREGSRHGIEEYVNIRAVTLALG